MSAPTKTHRTRRRGSSTRSKPDSVPWRELFKKDLQKRGEAGVYLRGLRLREGFTQKQLAAKLGTEVSQHHISEMENGKRPISKGMAKRLSKILHTDYRMFL